MPSSHTCIVSIRCPDTVSCRTVLWLLPVPTPKLPTRENIASVPRTAKDSVRTRQPAQQKKTNPAMNPLHTRTSHTSEPVTHPNPLHPIPSHSRIRYTAESAAHPNPSHSRIRYTPESISHSNQFHTRIHQTSESVTRPNLSHIRFRQTSDFTTYKPRMPLAAQHLYTASYATAGNVQNKAKNSRSRPPLPALRRKAPNFFRSPRPP